MKIQRMRWLYILISVLMAVSFGNGQTYKDETNLLGYLFEGSRYDKHVRPVHNRSTVLQVDISHKMRIISHVDVTSGTFCSFSNIEMSWLDEQLSWYPRDYGGIDTISLPEGQYWTPDLEKPFPGACGDRAQDELFKIENVTLTSEGKILLSVYKQLGALCIVDMTYYPFDKHTCIHQFYSTKYAHNELAVNFLNEIIVGEIYKENQEWRVSKTESYVVNLTLDRMSVAYASNHITIERRSSFILISKFLPAVLLMILHLSVPLVPPDSERLSFATTTYLALLFINLSFISDMPRNSIKIIMLSYFLLASNAIATLEVIWSIFIVGLSNTPTSKRKVPKFLLGLLEVKDKEVTTLKDEENDMDKPAKTADKLKDIGWYEVSRYLDKVYFIVSLFLVTIMFAVMVYIFNDMK